MPLLEDRCDEGNGCTKGISASDRAKIVKDLNQNTKALGSQTIYSHYMLRKVVH